MYVYNELAHARTHKPVCNKLHPITRVMSGSQSEHAKENDALQATWYHIEESTETEYQTYTFL